MGKVKEEKFLFLDVYFGLCWTIFVHFLLCFCLPLPPKKRANNYELKIFLYFCVASKRFNIKLKDKTRILKWQLQKHTLCVNHFPEDFWFSNKYSRNVGHLYMQFVSYFSGCLFFHFFSRFRWVLRSLKFRFDFNFLRDFICYVLKTVFYVLCFI